MAGCHAGRPRWAARRCCCVTPQCVFSGFLSGIAGGDELMTVNSSAQKGFGYTLGPVPVSVASALPGKWPQARRGAQARVDPWSSPATPHGAICRATLRAGPVSARCGVIRRSFAAANFYPHSLPRTETGPARMCLKREQALKTAVFTILRYPLQGNRAMAKLPSPAPRGAPSPTSGRGETLAPLSRLQPSMP